MTPQVYTLFVYALIYVQHILYYVIVKHIILTCVLFNVLVVASQNSLGSIDGDGDVDGDAEEPDEDDQNRCILCEKCFPDIEQ